MARASQSPLDALIAQSKRVTEDLMAARQDVQRAVATGSERDIHMAKSRLGMAYEQARATCDGIFDLYMAATSKETWIAAIPTRRRGLASGQLTLTGGR